MLWRQDSRGAMIYEGIEWLCGRFDPFAEKGGGLLKCGICLLVFEESYFFVLHLTVVRKQKAVCTEQVELAQSHLAMVCIDLDPL